MWQAGHTIRAGMRMRASQQRAGRWLIIVGGCALVSLKVRLDCQPVEGVRALGVHSLLRRN